MIKHKDGYDYHQHPDGHWVKVKKENKKANGKMLASKKEEHTPKK